MIIKGRYFVITPICVIAYVWLTVFVFTDHTCIHEGGLHNQWECDSSWGFVYSMIHGLSTLVAGLLFIAIILEVIYSLMILLFEWFDDLLTVDFNKKR